jgi:hypothetical protein
MCFYVRHDDTSVSDRDFLLTCHAVSSKDLRQMSRHVIYEGPWTRDAATAAGSASIRARQNGRPTACAQDSACKWTGTTVTQVE